MSSMSSQITGVSFVQPYVETQIKENTKAPHHWPLWGESTGDRWSPSQRASYAEIFVHLMTSSCYGITIVIDNWAFEVTILIANPWTNEVLEWVRNFISHLMMYVIIHSGWDDSALVLVNFNYPSNLAFRNDSKCTYIFWVFKTFQHLKS